MPRFNVEADGKWACFSTMVDGFITPFMPLDEYNEWRKKEYGIHCGSVEHANRMTLAEALFDLSLNKDDKEICDNLRECGLFDTREEMEEENEEKEPQTVACNLPLEIANITLRNEATGEVWAKIIPASQTE